MIECIDCGDVDGPFVARPVALLTEVILCERCDMQPHHAPTVTLRGGPGDFEDSTTDDPTSSTAANDPGSGADASAMAPPPPHQRLSGTTAAREPGTGGES